MTSTINPNIPVNRTDVDAPPIQANFQAAYNDINALQAAAALRVTAVSVATANGVSGSSSGGNTPALTIQLNDITPSSVAAAGQVSGLSTAAGASVAQTIAAHFGYQLYAEDFGAVGDGTTDDTAAIQLALDTMHTNYPTGSMLLFRRGTYVASQIKIYRQQILKSADGVQACTLLQKAASNKDFIISENFAALNGSGAVYGTDPLVPSWFGIQDMHVNGNASNQGAGAWRGVAWYGNAQLMLGQNLIENCKQDNIYTESAGGYAYSVTDWRAQEEGFFDNVISRNAGRYGWLNRGPHDSTIINYIGLFNGSTGYRSETSGTTYIGSAHIHFIHTYANLDFTGQYYGSPSTIIEAYSDFDNVTIASAEVIISKLYQIQCGYGGVNALEFTPAALYCMIGVHNMDFYPSITNVVGVNIQAGGGQVTIGHSQCALLPGTSGITGYKVRSSFCQINALMSNIGGVSSIALDLAADFCRFTGVGFSNTTAIKYTPGSNNFVQFQIYGGTTVLNGTPGVTDTFQISADTGFVNISPGLNMTSGGFDSAGNYYLNNFGGGIMSGYYLPGYQTQLTQKGAEANSGFSKQVPSTGFSITIDRSVSYLILDPAGTLAAGTITMPDAPVNGQKASISSSQTITALTLSPNSGQSIKNAATTLVAGTKIAYRYVAANTTWYVD